MFLRLDLILGIGLLIGAISEPTPSLELAMDGDILRMGSALSLTDEQKEAGTSTWCMATEQSKI